MDDKLKIILGSEDIISRENEDLFININLNRSFFEYKKEKYDNDFDLAKQFEKERNESRNFRVYGTISSNVEHFDNYPYKVYSDSGLTNLIQSSFTTPLNFGGCINVYNKKRGKYYIPLDNFSGDSIYILIPKNNVNISDQVFEQKLVFYGLDGEFIPYGTETVDVDENLNTVDINNNFPFFYNKHWVKKNIEVEETKLAIVSFVNNTGLTINEGQLVNMVVGLDKPSPFGNEKVDFTFDSANSTADFSDFLVYCGTTSNIFPGTVNLQFNIGEQFKTITFQALNDLNVELFENLTFKLSNFVSVLSGSPITNVINIVDQTPRHYAKFIISNMYENRTPYVGSSAYTLNPNLTYSTPSIFRNGLYYNGDQREFYPIDNFTLEIQNTGNKTLLPANSGLGNELDDLWLPGQVKTFSISPRYSDTTLNEVEIFLPPSLNSAATSWSSFSYTTNQISISQVIDNISINGFVLKYQNGSYGSSPMIITPPDGVSLAYEAFKQMVNGSTTDYYTLKGVHKPFTIRENPSAYTITLISNSPGVRLDVRTDASTSFSTPPLPGKIATATTTVAFSYPTQLPFEFTLLGNSNSNTEASYIFSFKKKGIKTLNVLRSASAGLTPINNYLVTAYRDVLYNWDAARGEGLIFSGNPFAINFPSTGYLLPKGDVYYQGVALLSDSDPYKNYNYNLTNYGPSILNLYTSSYWGPTAADFAVWTTTPLNIIPETSQLVSSSNKSQKGLMIIRSSGFNSFDFRNGLTGSSKTFYWNSAFSVVRSSHLYPYPTSFLLSVSGTSDPARVSVGLSKELDAGGTFSTNFYGPPSVFSSITIPIGPIHLSHPAYAAIQLGDEYYAYLPTNNSTITYGYANAMNNIDTILMSAKTPGVPFEVDNFVVSSGVSNIIKYIPITANEIAGVTSNPYNNLMGGYSVTPP